MTIAEKLFDKGFNSGWPRLTGSTDPRYSGPGSRELCERVRKWSSMPMTMPSLSCTASTSIILDELSYLSVAQSTVVLADQPFLRTHLYHRHHQLRLPFLSDSVIRQPL